MCFIKNGMVLPHILLKNFKFKGLQNLTWVSEKLKALLGA